ncbi:MAG: Trk system potassium transporter TrkA [Planctomycetes bacterium]|nr:Trk system potassium transporter TrkA [Planctomycetota bacterium]
MRIVIVGAGAVGFNLATELSREGIDVAVIETDPLLIKRIREKLDVQVVAGSGTQVRNLKEAGIENAEFLIAVTNIDEVNQVACMMANTFRVRRKIARVRNKDFTCKTPVIPKRDFHINRIINPDEITIDYIMKVMETPGASDAGDFADGEILLRGFQITGDEGLHDLPLAELKSRYDNYPFLIAAILREGNIIIPMGTDVLLPGDTVYMIMSREVFPHIQNLLSKGAQKIGKVVISGAGRIAVELASRMEQRVDRVTLIGEDKEACQEASDQLGKGLVVYGDLMDEDVAHEVHLGTADFFIATHENDQKNLIHALMAKKRGVKRTAIITNDPDIVQILGSLDVDVVINARLITVGEILRFVKPGKVLSVKKIGDSEAEIIEVIVGKGSKAIGKSLKNLKLPKGALIGAIYRNGIAFIPDGTSTIMQGDNVVAFVLPQVGKKLENLLAGRKRITFIDSKKS